MIEQKEQREFTGVWIPSEVYLNEDICWSAKIIFIEIHSYTSRGGDCFFGNEHIAKFVGISIRQVQKHLVTLTEIGWIEETYFDGRRRHLRSRMRFISDMNKSSPQQRIKVHPSSEQKNAYTNTNTNTSTNSINIPFTSFWELYNKKVGDRSKCEKKWNKLGPGEREKIMKTLPDFLKRITDKQFQPHPATYLNQKRWEDELTTISGPGKGIDLDNVKH